MKNLRDKEISDVVNFLRNIVRAEYAANKNFLEYYAEKKYLDKVNNLQNQVIYGRRGTGKTHLLRALQEAVIVDFDNVRIIPVYIDLRKFKPLLQESNPMYCALIVFKEIALEVFAAIIENIPTLFGLNEYTQSDLEHIKSIKQILQKYAEDLNYSLDGINLTKLGDVDFDINEVKNYELSLGLSSQPYVGGKVERKEDLSGKDKRLKYISFAEISEILNTLVFKLNLERVMLLLDEWSEISKDYQYILAELLKTAFIASGFTCKLAAIPNRTKLINDKRIGLEDGGDIFGISLDNRFIYEINPLGTKAFFNELLFNHMSTINPELFSEYYDKENKQPSVRFIEDFLNPNAMKELLIASSGIPRDFINIFINSYMKYEDSGTTYKTISVRDVRKGTTEWYEVDKKKAVESQQQAKILLDSIINEIIINRKSCHFLVPQLCSTNDWFQSLIDLRVIHLRKEGISHKGKKNVAYNVYYIDYACYTSSNIYHNKIASDLLDSINMSGDFDRIRRVSLEKEFFDTFNIQVGNSFKCPNCGEMVDTNHLAYINLKACNMCFKKIENI